ncbi:unhealthy ribosome biogenesis protein 2 homolog [Plakobranchus ocellatus]|uniref:Unhealthy ribosome biogenesis protein 2 homolog n=1 Tax=Plakobranchus ocellatus TaxID=259542 RepID=A0AAV4AB07_9GAST|nr:unhealthy ribosome biogenesis protein 2 homolog [Plakobranchus ocellatus]
MNLGGEERLASQPGQILGVIHSARLVSRLLTLLSSPTYKAELQKVAHTVLAEYLVGVQKQTLHAPVKAELLRGLYKLMDVCDKFRLAALNAALPAGLKDTFKFMHQEYNKYHRYTGVV